MTRQIPLLINSDFVKSTRGQALSVLNSTTQELSGEPPFATQQEIETAVAGAKSALSTWKEDPVSERARYLQPYLQLLTQHHDGLAGLFSQDTGKIFEAAKGDARRLTCSRYPIFMIIPIEPRLPHRRFTRFIHGVTMA